MTERARRLNLNYVNGPVGPYRDIDDLVDISSGDYEDDEGFTFSAQAAGEVTFLTLLKAAEGGPDQSRMMTAGETLTGPGGIPVTVVAVRENATVGAINIGML